MKAIEAYRIAKEVEAVKWDAEKAKYKDIIDSVYNKIKEAAQNGLYDIKLNGYSKEELECIVKELSDYYTAFIKPTGGNIDDRAILISWLKPNKTL